MIKEYHYHFKLAIVGNTQVGKSSLLQRFSEDIFHHIQTTNIVEFYYRTLRIEGKKVKLQIWDTDGSDKFDATENYFYKANTALHTKDADGIIIVYDVNNQKSYDAIDKYWMQEIKKHSLKHTEMLLIGNKSDLNLRKYVFMPQTPQSIRIPKEKAQQYASTKSMEFAEVSAKTAEYVEDSFSKLVRKLMNIQDILAQKTYITESSALKLGKSKTMEVKQSSRCSC